MSFTAPLWNELVFEKINELQLAHQEMFKHLASLSHRMNHLENRFTNISSGLSLVLTHLHRESKEANQNRTNPVTPTSTSTYGTTTPIPTHIGTGSMPGTSHLILQRANSHPSSNNIVSSNQNHSFELSIANPSPRPINFTNMPFANHTNPQLISNASSASNMIIGTGIPVIPKEPIHDLTSNPTHIPSDGEVQNYVDDPEEGEWTKVSRRRK